MKLWRVFGFAVSVLVFLGWAADRAEARSSRRDDRTGGSYRLIGGDEDREKKREEERKKEEEAKRKQEEARKQQEAKKREAAAAAAKKAQAAATKPATPAKPKATQTARKTGKQGAAEKTDEALEAEAEKLRAQADAAFEKGTEDGLLAGAQLLRQLLAEYDGTDAAASAREQLDLLLADAECGPRILLAEAEEEFGAQHYRKARNKFQELVQRHPKSEQATEARARLAEIERDDLLRKSVYTEEELEEARLWLLAGNIHLENGRTGDAAAAYRRVIEEYPGCRYATLAEERLPATQGS